MRYKLWYMVVALVLIGAAVNADPPKVEKKDNHWSPLMAEVTFKDPKVKPQTCMIYGVGRGSLYTPHTWELTDGTATVKVWLDTIAEVKEIDDKRLTVVSKDDTKRDFIWAGDRSPDHFLFYQPDDTRGTVEIAKVKTLKFLKAPRADKEKNAMFDHWRFSPFTGEKLPPVKDE